MIAVVMIVWGPNEIPKLARMLGQARQQFELAQKEFANPTAEQPMPRVISPPPVSTTDDALFDSAQRLGVTTKGRTRDELVAEVARRAVQAVSVPTGSQGATNPAPGTQAATVLPVGKEKDEHEKLVAAARELGISTEGRSSEQLKAEIRNALA